jgi:integrase
MGCIRKKGETYRVDWRDKKGNRYRQTFELKKDAEDFLSQVKVDIKHGAFISAKTAPLFSEVAEQWFENKRNRRPATLSAWRTHLDKHLLPALGDLRLSEIDVGVIEAKRNQWLDAKNVRCEDGHLSPQTVNKLLATLSGIFEFARKRKKCVGNVAKDAERVRVGNGEITAEATSRRHDPDEVTEDEVLNPAEILALIEQADAGYYRTLFMLAAFTGARHDELLALQWPDLDLENGKVTIRRSLSWARLPGEEVRPRFFQPKTKAGTRKVPLVPEVVHALKVWKLQCPPGAGELVFPTPQGLPMHRGTVLRVGLYPALRRAGLRRVDMHSLRHSFASGLIAQGAPVTEVQHYLGHEKPTTTLKVYSRWFSQSQTDSVARFARGVLSGTWTPNGHSAESDPPAAAANA